MVVTKLRKVQAEALQDDTIVVTARQSRYLELDDSNDKDIDINDLCLSIGKREILQHTRLVLKAGLRYVFHARNGLGKSTILKALAERRMPGVPPIVRIQLLDQSLIEKGQKDMLQETGKGVRSVIDSVVGSDLLRQRLVDDVARLSDAIQDPSDSATKTVKVYRELKLEEARRELTSARLVAKHRSGARGSKARQVEMQKEDLLESREEA